MQFLSPITITKASGIKELFSEEKVAHSLSMSGLSDSDVSRALDYLRSHLKPDMTTGAIYSHVYSYLQKNSPQENYFSYGLKRAVMDMGPSGYPFETLISDLLRKYSYKTEVGVVTQGKCVTHEIDVIALKDTDKYFIECKYHNSPGFKTDIQVALYSYARFQDISSAQLRLNPNQINHSWLITNTKVTSEVIDYSKCVGVKVTTWTSPVGEGLQDLIEDSGVYPITILVQINNPKAKLLLDLGIVTCSSLKTAILNNKTRDILDDKEKSLILKEISSINKE